MGTQLEQVQSSRLASCLGELLFHAMETVVRTPSSHAKAVYGRRYTTPLQDMDVDAQQAAET